jgi:hypothetical protein
MYLSALTARKERAFMKEKIEVAWRVLTCTQNHTDPVEADVESLRSWVDPLDRAADNDDLAYIVIAAEVEHRDGIARKTANLQ